MDSEFVEYYYLFTDDYVERVYPGIFASNYPNGTRKYQRDEKREKNSLEYSIDSEGIIDYDGSILNMNTEYSYYIKFVSKPVKYQQAEKVYLFIKNNGDKLLFFEDFVNILYYKVKDIYDSRSFFKLTLQENYLLSELQKANLGVFSLDYAEYKSFLEDFSLFEPLMKKIRKFGFDDKDPLQKVLLNNTSHYDEITNIVNDLFPSDLKFEIDQIKKDILEKILSKLKIFPQVFINHFWEKNRQLLRKTGLYNSTLVSEHAKNINSNYGKKKEKFDIIPQLNNEGNVNGNFLTNKEILDEELLETEKEQIIKSRIGQSTFKKSLLAVEKKCKLCGVSDERFLIASHIKPWSKSNNQERLDVHNGLLLCPNHDSLFDKGYISFDDDGCIIISNSLDEATMIFLNIANSIMVNLNEGQQGFMKWHRENVFKF